VVNEVDNQDKTFVSRADFLPFFAICLGQNPAGDTAFRSGSHCRRAPGSTSAISPGTEQEPLGRSPWCQVS
jgi:hypothetical protein